MSNNTAYAYLSELISNLDEKINELSMAISSADQDDNEKVRLIKDNAISVLNNVKEKSVELAKVITDEEELQAAFLSIRNKADSLYDEAMQKINDLREDAIENNDDETTDDIEELMDDHGVDKKEEYVDFQKQESSDENKKLEAARSPVTMKALEVLKDWLRPDEVIK